MIRKPVSIRTSRAAALRMLPTAFFLLVVGCDYTPTEARYYLSGGPVEPVVPEPLPPLGDYPALEGPGRVFEFDMSTLVNPTPESLRALSGTRYVLYENGAFTYQVRAGGLLRYDMGRLWGTPEAWEAKGTYTEAGTSLVLQWPWGPDWSATATLVGDRLSVEPSINVQFDFAPQASYLRVP
jgi:hypothetical protein